jgi:hypothetical protein
LVNIGKRQAAQKTGCGVKTAAGTNAEEKEQDWDQEEIKSLSGKGASDRPLAPVFHRGRRGLTPFPDRLSEQDKEKEKARATAHGVIFLIILPLLLVLFLILLVILISLSASSECPVASW